VRRPAGLVFSAVALMLLSMFQVVMALLMAFSGMVQANHPLATTTRSGHPTPPVPSWMPFFSYGVGAFFVALAAWGIVTAIGVFRLRQWARISILVIGGGMALIGLVSVLCTLVFLLIPLPSQPGLNPSQAEVAHTMVKVVLGIVAAFYGLLFALGVFWLVYFNRAGVRTVFANGAGADVQSRRPLILSAIAILMILGAPACLLAIFIPVPGVIFGFPLRGWEKGVTYLVIVVLQAAGGIGLWQMREWGRRLMMGIMAFGAINCALYVAWPSLVVRYSEEISRSMNIPGQYQLPAHFQRMVSAGSSGLSLLFILAIVAVLHHYRARFDRPIGPSQIKPLQTA